MIYSWGVIPIPEVILPGFILKLKIRIRLEKFNLIFAILGRKRISMLKAWSLMYWPIMNGSKVIAMMFYGLKEYVVMGLIVRLFSFSSNITLHRKINQFTLHTLFLIHIANFKISLLQLQIHPLDMLNLVNYARLLEGLMFLF